jgi:predicted glycoside hydrolase/deacetylase ChbG (UPF0249 family)
MMAPRSVQAKRVIVCADDFAVHGGASRGIAELARSGRISATSVMVLSPRWPQDVALLRDLPQAMDIGLHLDWTSEFAIAHGHGMSLYSAMLRATLSGFGRGAAAGQTRAVIERQLDAFEAQWKAPPDYVDGHQHVQQFAGIREALVQALVKRYGPDQLPYLRISRAPLGHADLKSRVISAMGASALEKLAARAGLPAMTVLLGVYDFAGDQNRYSGLMEGWLKAAPERCIIMCHPARESEPQDALGAARLWEFNYLSGAQFPAALERAAVRVVRGNSFDR